MKPQKIIKRTDKTAPLVINNKQINEAERRAEQIVASDKPIRTVYYVEVKDLEPLRVQLLIQEVSRNYSQARGGVHYILPVRHGKIGPELMFEEEFLKVANQLCEVVDGKIVMKSGAQEVRIIREKI
jgi:hypothetical protein